MAGVLVAAVAVVEKNRASGAMRQVHRVGAHFALFLEILAGGRGTAVDVAGVVAILSDGDVCGYVSFYRRYSASSACHLC